eukprot:Sdes_comp15804_c0_seq1m4877
MDAQQQVTLEALNQLTPETISKYHAAADIVNTAMHTVINHCVAGASVYLLCANSDQLMETHLSRVFKSKCKRVDDTVGYVEKGVAFPTCISINNCCGYYSPWKEEGVLLSHGDVVKVELGVHIDGFIVTSAHTHIVTPDIRCPAIGRVADVVCATHLASEVALRLLRPGNWAHDITQAIETIAEAYHCKPLANRFSRLVTRYNIEGAKGVILASNDACELPEENFQFSAGEVYSIDISMSTDAGCPRPMDIRSSVFKRNVNNSYRLKLTSATQLMGKILKASPVMPFAFRKFIDGSKSLLGLKELCNHDLLSEYPVLFEKPGSSVAHFKFTAFLHPGSDDTIRLTSCPPPHCFSQFQVENSKIADILSSKAPKVKTAPVRIIPLEDQRKSDMVM